MRKPDPIKVPEIRQHIFANRHAWSNDSDFNETRIAAVQTEINALDGLVHDGEGQRLTGEFAPSFEKTKAVYKRMAILTGERFFLMRRAQGKSVSMLDVKQVALRTLPEDMFQQ